MPRRWSTLAAVLGLAALGSAVAVSRGALDGDDTTRAPGTAAAVEPSAPRPSANPTAHDSAPAPGGSARAAPEALAELTPLALPAFDPGGVPRYIAAASGPVPELNQVSLEQDIALAAAVLGPGGRVLFGAGPGTPTVQVLARVSPAEPVTAPGVDGIGSVALALGELFSPRARRDLDYRPTRLTEAEPATAQTVMQALDHALASGSEPLLLYLGGHGNQGELPRHNTVSLWAESELRVVDLASRLDQSPRPVRLVVTTCFSGGFADVVFRAADEALGPSPTPRCGLFAAPWDLEATGCDPNPDRAAHDGYGLHVLEALRGHDRRGEPLPLPLLDLDGDGRISLLEAHTRARIASDAADVPTSTTERWLRHAAPSHGPELAVHLPEEDAVVEALAARLGLHGREADAALELQHLHDDLEATLRSLDDAHLTEEATYRRAAADLLARWPVLDDPWHPAHARVLTEQHDALAEHLERSPSYADYLAARRDVDRLGQRSWELRHQAAPYERLTRALDNRRLARRLRAQGGEAWAVFEQILSCERGLP